mmetsp:Transcript_30618/g.117062  ORF Transcript_30618/g.117062 Transcript_30618/m.117062 type:complete len:614 (-) Transcript_30618:3062-4903(-)
MNTGGFSNGGGGAQGYSGYGVPPQGVVPAEARPLEADRVGSGQPAEEEQEGSKVLLTILCRDLIGLQGHSPRTSAVVYLKSFGVHDWKAVGKTEVHPPSSNPDFSGSVAVHHIFQRYQELRVAVFESRVDGEEPSPQNLIGSADVRLASVIAAPPGSPFKAQLVNVRSPRSPGTVLIATTTGVDPARRMVRTLVRYEDYEPTPEDDDPLVHGKPKRNLFHRKGRPNEPEQPVSTEPRLYIYRSPDLNEIQPGTEAASASAGALTNLDFYTEVFMSDPMRPSSAPVLSDGQQQEGESESSGFNCAGEFEVVVNSSRLNRGNDQRLIYLCVQKGDTTIGGVFSTMQHLIQPVYTAAPLSLSPGGRLLFGPITQNYEPSFTDRLCRGEIELNLMMAVDFTASNGDPNQRGSLHSLVPGVPNVYEAVMRTIGNIVLPICSTDYIPAYGFGAKIPPHNNLSHCFALSGVPERYMVQGVDGLINAYKSSVANAQLHGPTIFSDVIDTASTILSRMMESGVQRVQYMVLTIISDGVLSDGETFMSKLVHTVSPLPISIVIIGVGNEDFGKMPFFLGDENVPPRSGNKQAARNCLTFATMKSVDNDLGRLAEKILRRFETK